VTDYLAVVIGRQRYNAVASLSQLSYEFSLRQSTEGGRDHLVNSFRVSWAFIADVNHCPLEHGALPQASVGKLGIESVQI
jgi:hypothetical protein